MADGWQHQMNVVAVTTFFLLCKNWSAFFLSSKELLLFFVNWKSRAELFRLKLAGWLAGSYQWFYIYYSCSCCKNRQEFQSTTIVSFFFLLIINALYKSEEEKEKKRGGRQATFDRLKIVRSRLITLDENEEEEEEEELIRWQRRQSLLFA